MNIFLKDVIKHTKKEQAYLKLQVTLRALQTPVLTWTLQPQLFNVVAKVMEHSRNIDATLAMVRLQSSRERALTCAHAGRTTSCL